VNYALTVQAHASAAALRAFHTIQKIEAKAVIEIFRILARKIIELEMTLRSIKRDTQ
jgi:hypothetical protein